MVRITNVSQQCCTSTQIIPGIGLQKYDRKIWYYNNIGCPKSFESFKGSPLFTVSAANASMKPVILSYRHSWWALPFAHALRWATTTADPSKPPSGKPSEENGSLPRGGLVMVSISWGLDLMEIVLRENKRVPGINSISWNWPLGTFRAGCKNFFSLGNG